MQQTYVSPIMAPDINAGSRFAIRNTDDGPVVTGDLPVVVAVAAVVEAGAAVVAAGAAVYMAYTAYTAGGCFLPGTAVNTGKRSYKPIQDLQIGDLVLSYDGKRKAITQSPVVSTFKTIQPGYCVINDTLHVTETHPFFVDEKWVNVKDLKEGTTFLNDDLQPVVVKSIRKVDTPVIVHNVTVANTHTFFVDNILVHNKKEIENQDNIA